MGKMWQVHLLASMLVLVFFLLVIRKSLELDKMLNMLDEPIFPAQGYRPLDTCEEKNVVCVAKENFLLSVPEVLNLEQCKQHCLDFKECNFISYFYADSFPLSNHCMLFEDCKETSSCQDCHSM